jgi:hypothetical protein
VSIGLDKSTKLSAVFNRYVDFCNETGNERIYADDLEFVHCQLLNGTDTAEASALMKNDKIAVRRVRTTEREAEVEKKRLQRDADRNFFQQLRHLMPDLGGSKTADVIFDCKGKLLDESGRNQQVLCTTVRAHSAIISKRCKWLGDIIQQTRVEVARRSMVLESNTLEDEDENTIRRVESDGKSDNQDEEDDGIEVLSYSPKEKKAEASGAAEIENDDEEDQPFDEPRNVVERSQSGSPVITSQQQTDTGKDLLCVTLPDHSPEAVKLLLEYCHTNRILPLGQEAFVQACKSKPHKHQGPVPPYQNTSSGARRWPNSGHPVASFSVILAGLSLAEEAGMHRLSLMCEVAASQLLSISNVVEALSMCTAQKSISGNDLPRLRKAAMDIVLRSGSRGVVELGRTPAFRRALEERRSFIVPTLLQGTMEAVATYDKSRGVKRDSTNVSYPSFEELDREDSYKRERERRKRRQERWETDPSRRAEHSFEEELDDFYDLQGWASETAKRSLKRMSHHLDMASRRAVVLSRSGGFSFSRRSSNRRRSSQG